MSARRFRNAALLGAVLLLAAAAAGSPGVRPFAYRVARHFGFVSPPPPLKSGQALASVPLRTLDGDAASLPGDRAGHAMLINVFTSWCPSCNQEMPALSRAAPALARDGIEVVGVDQSESGDRVKQFLQAYGVTYPVYIDADSSTRRSLDARVIPTTLFVDRHGVVRYIHAGPLDVAAFLSLARAAE